MSDLASHTLPLPVVAALFDPLPDVVFFAKDRAGRYRAVNATLVERTGFSDKHELIGRLPSEILGEHLGASYELQDRSVVRTGVPIEQRLELHVYPNRTVGWCLTTKYPTFDAHGTLDGLTGISQDLRSPNMSRGEYDEVAGTVERVRSDLAGSHPVGALAERAGLSPFRLNRRFRQVFGLNLGQWIVKQRVDEAQKLLRESDTAIAEVALAVGYSDQSAFTRQFRLTTGLTPKKFRLFAGTGSQPGSSPEGNGGRGKD